MQQGRFMRKGERLPDPAFKSGVTWQSDGQTFQGLVGCGPAEDDTYMVCVVGPKGEGKGIVKVNAKDLRPAVVRYIRPGAPMAQSAAAQQDGVGPVFVRMKRD